MTFSEILDHWKRHFALIEDVDSFDAIDKYLYFYHEAALRYLSTFEYCRLKQLEMVRCSDSPSIASKTDEFQNRERKCILAIESVYTYLHRIEIIVRPEKNRYDIEPKLNFPEFEKKRWLSDLRYMSEIRNKVIEHAPENLTYHSNWGQIFNAEDPFEFRLWILNPNALKLIHHDARIINEVDEKVGIISNLMPHNHSGPFAKWMILNEGARYLSNDQIKSLFDNALKQLGCISHKPIELATKLSNLSYFIFLSENRSDS